VSTLPDTTILDLLPEAAVIVERPDIVSYCNAMGARLARTTPAAAVGRPASEVFTLYDEGGRSWWACAQPFDADARLLPRIPEIGLTLRVGGEDRPVILTARRVPGADGKVERLLVCLRSAGRRQRLDAARSDLVSTVSHEIRSPLTSVKGFTKTMLAKWDRFSDEQKQQMLATVEEDADRVTRLLGELLDVSRIDAGRLQLRRQMVDVAALAQRVLDRFAVADDGDRLVARFPNDLPRLYADPDKLEQIFTNLLENALKYGDGQVEVSGEVGDEEVRFTVADDGQGIPEGHLGSIFTKFFRRAGERRSGTGLGLYITRGLVNAHGGHVWAQSAPGQGARFHFTLPRGGLELAGADMSALRRAGEKADGRGAGHSAGQTGEGL
jgi:signal transduction histidine kinase